MSLELDPDTFRQLEKFRKVQGHVKSSKTKYEEARKESTEEGRKEVREEGKKE